MCHRTTRRGATERHSPRPAEVHLSGDLGEPGVAGRQRFQGDDGGGQGSSGGGNRVVHRHPVQTRAGDGSAGGQEPERAEVAAVEGAVFVGNGEQLLGGKGPHERACRMRDSIPA